MSMKKIFESYRKGNLIEKNAGWYRTPEEDIPNEKADYPRSNVTQLKKSKQRRAAKGIVSFNSDDSDYNITGNTHGRFSHMIKHAWEFPSLSPIYMTAVYAAQKMIRSYVKKTDENPTLPKLYFVKAGQKGQILSYEKGDENSNDSNSEYRHPEATATTSGPIISNTWDYIQDKLQTGEGPIHPTERIWFAVAKPVATVYNRKAQKTMKASKNIANYDDATIEKFWDNGKTISFQNIHAGKQNTNYMNKKGELISKRDDGLVATYFILSNAGKGLPGLNPAIHIPAMCNYLNKEDSHPEAKRLAKIICVSEDEPEGEPQESPSPNLSPETMARLAMAAAAAAAAGVVATGAGGALGGLKPAVSRVVSRIHVANMLRAGVRAGNDTLRIASNIGTFGKNAGKVRSLYALRFARLAGGPAAIMLGFFLDAAISASLGGAAYAATKKSKCAPSKYGLNRCQGRGSITPEKYAELVAQEIPKEHAVLSYMKYGVINIANPGGPGKTRILEKEMSSAEKSKLEDFENAFGVLGAKTIDNYRKSGTFENFSRDPSAKYNKNPFKTHDRLHKSGYASITYSHEPEFNAVASTTPRVGPGAYMRRENNALNERTGKGYPSTSQVLKMLADARSVTMNEQGLAPINAEMARMAMRFTERGSRNGKQTIGDNYYKEYERLQGQGITKRFISGQSSVKGGGENYTVTSRKILVAVLHDYLSIKHDLYSKNDPAGFLEEFINLYFKSKDIATTPAAEIALGLMAEKAMKISDRKVGLPLKTSTDDEGWTEDEWKPIDFNKDPDQINERRSIKNFNNKKVILNIKKKKQ